MTMLRKIDRTLARGRDQLLLRSVLVGLAVVSVAGLWSDACLEVLADPRWRAVAAEHPSLWPDFERSERAAEIAGGIVESCEDLDARLDTTAELLTQALGL